MILDGVDHFVLPGLVHVHEVCNLHERRLILTFYSCGVSGIFPSHTFGPRDTRTTDKRNDLPFRDYFLRSLILFLNNLISLATHAHG